MKGVAKRLLAHVHEKLVLDWRRKAETMADVRVAIRDVLDELPDDPYPRRVYDDKVQVVFDHVSHGVRRRRLRASTTEPRRAAGERTADAESSRVDEITDVGRRADPLRRRVRRTGRKQLRGETPTFARTHRRADRQRRGRSRRVQVDRPLGHARRARATRRSRTRSSRRSRRS